MDSRNRKEYSSLRMLIWTIVLVVCSTGLFLPVYHKLMGSLFAHVETQRKQNLTQVVSIARHAVEPILVDFRSGKLSASDARNRMRDIVRRMTYDDQYGMNYIFMSTYDGLMLVQPFEPHMEMTNQWDLRDDKGVFIIRELARNARMRPSGSFLSYSYHLPGVYGTQEKLAYVIGLPELNCYIGTGMYMQKAIREQKAILNTTQYAAIGLILIMLIIEVVAVAAVSRRNHLLSREIEIREHAEDALKRSEAHYRDLVGNARTIILRWDLEGRILFFNEFGEELFGFTQEEVLGKRVTETIVPPRESTGRDLHDMIEQITRNTEAFITNVNENVSKDGRRFWILWKNRLITDESGTKREILSVGSDITALKQAEETLWESKQRYHTFIDSTDDLAYMKDEQFRYILVNKANREFFRLTEEEILGRTDFDLMPHENAAGCRLSDEKAIAANGIVISQETVGNKVYETRKFPIPLKNGKTGVGAIVRDITYIKHAEEERIDLERNLLHTQKLESLGVLAGGIAHDFNNLMMAVLGNLELALMDLSPTSSSRSSIDNAVNAAKRAADLTRQMLAYSGRGRLMVTEFELGDLVVENVHLLKAAISKNVVLNLDIVKSLPRIKADAGQIQQVVMNLITNASEAIGDNPGTVNLKTGMVECDDATLSASRTIQKPDAGVFVYLEVSDNGCGMDEETLQRLFEPFYTTKFTGRGLGMAGVQGIVSGHNGALFVESEQGKGSAIRVMFPVSSEAIPTDSPVQPPLVSTLVESPVQPPPGYILVVDDERSIRSLSQRILDMFGYQSLTASDGEEAEVLFREHADEIICVLLDLTMPKKDGVATMESLRRIRPDVRIILSSGFSEQDAVQRFTDIEKPAGFIQKPYTLQNLRREIERIIQSDSA